MVTKNVFNVENFVNFIWFLPSLDLTTQIQHGPFLFLGNQGCKQINIRSRFWNVWFIQQGNGELKMESQKLIVFPETVG